MNDCRHFAAHDTAIFHERHASLIEQVGRAPAIGLGLSRFRQLEYALGLSLTDAAQLVRQDGPDGTHSGRCLRLD